MSTRISSLGLLILLAACSRSPGNEAAAVDQAQAGAADDNGGIACRPAGTPDFARACMVDRVAGPDGLVLTVRNPDGAFHRLLVTKDGRGVVAADGAEQAKVSIAGEGLIEVAIGNDRYRLPATVKGQ
jgi:hypothetical protein